MRKSPENTGRKQGNRGKPGGRPPGSRNKTILAVDALLDGEPETLTRTAIERAKVAFRLEKYLTDAPMRTRAITNKG